MQPHSGAIYSKNSVSVKNTILKNNNADSSISEDYYGGAIYAQGDINLKNTTFKNNKAVGDWTSAYGSCETIRSKKNVKIDNCFLKKN